MQAFDQNPQTPSILTSTLTSTDKIKIFALSLLLAPLGLWWFFKYFKSQDAEKRKVAFIVLAITVAATALSIITIIGYLYAIKGYIATPYQNYKELGL